VSFEVARSVTQSRRETEDCPFSNSRKDAKTQRNKKLCVLAPLRETKQRSDFQVTAVLREN
jgi:hypothetical protein